MGWNVDLTQMLGLPERAKCVKCEKEVSTYFDDYDIDCGDPNPRPGYWQVYFYCSQCQHENHYTVLASFMKENP